MRTRTKRIIALVLAVMTAALMLTACGTASTSTSSGGTDTAKSDSDWDYVSGKGELVIGYTLFAPMNYMENDELVGFETEYAKAVCEKLGVTPKFVEINWDTKEVELNAKTIDCIWNGMTITDERKENMSVTEPYMNNRQVMIVRQADVDKYTESVDGAKVVAEAGSTGEELAQADEFFKSAQYTGVDSQAKGLMEVKSGVSDVVIADYVLSIGMVGEGTDYSDLAIIDKNFDPQEYGVAFRKGSDITEKVEKATDELLSDGTLQSIAEKYKLGDLLIKD